MSLMLKELQPFLLFLYRETVSKNRKRRDREQVCLSVHSLPERAPGPCRTAGAHVPQGGSPSPGFPQEGIQLNPPPPLFPCQSCSLVPLPTPTALPREPQGLRRGCSCLLSALLPPLFARRSRPPAPLSRCSPAGARPVGRGRWGRGKAEGHAPFSLLRSGVRPATPYPGRIFTSCCK